MNQIPKIKKAILIKTTRIPPKYFPHSSCAREIGFDNNKSMFPFSSITGTKLALEKIARSRPKLAIELIITISNIVTIPPMPSVPSLLSREKFPILPRMEDVFVRIVISASTIITIAEIPRKNKKTFLAIASLKVDNVIIQMFFNSSPPSLIFL